MSGYSPEAGGGKTDFVYRLKARFLAKPCASHTILEMVRSCLDEKAPVAELGEAGQAK
jgi:hypothetical protein